MTNPPKLNTINQIQVSGLCKSFDRTAKPKAPSATEKPLSVLCDFSLSIQTGEIVALIGRSGCGKTTLLHCLAGLVKPDSGMISPADLSRTCAVVFQDHRLLPWASLEKNLFLALQARKDLTKDAKRQRVCAMLMALDLNDAAQSKPSALSGGMAQRAALGRALLQQPDLLLMDEPFASLDALTRMDMHALLMELHDQRDQTILLVTHDLEEAVKLADRILVMEAGAIIEECPIIHARPRDLDSHAMRAIQRHLRQRITGREAQQPLSEPNQKPSPKHGETSQ